MTAEEIRKWSKEFQAKLGGVDPKRVDAEGLQFIAQCAILEVLIEITAQLAEIREAK